MISVLGIDAAWTATQPSGIALVAREDTEPWSCLSVAPSYTAFLGTAEGNPIPWAAQVWLGGAPDAGRLLSAVSRLLGGHTVDLVTIDMPVSRTPITGRRAADDAISREFGAAGCGTHSPNTTRPGALGGELTSAFAGAGYPVATVGDKAGTLARLVEVYPHPALLRLMNERTRLHYKVSKSGKYWPSSGVCERIANLIAVYERILAALTSEIQDIRLPLPTVSSCSCLSSLKRYEDALDALVCAWVGCQYVDGHAAPFGDAAAAIWIPDARTIPT